MKGLNLPTSFANFEIEIVIGGQFFETTTFGAIQIR
jgi:hypothetical protein